MVFQFLIIGVQVYMQEECNFQKIIVEFMVHLSQIIQLEQLNLLNLLEEEMY